MVDPEMRAQYEAMKKQLDDMPEAQRAMAERMMKGQMEQLEKMMEGGDDAMTVQTTVRELRVNQGPPN
jgi:putative component of toxin-antitoxin plasmid stabilization module